MLVNIEPKGEQLIESSLKDIIEMNNKVFSVLEEEEKNTLEHLLKKLVYSLNK
jgi:DNA-binding MarR family transcriptional regulator